MRLHEIHHAIELKIVVWHFARVYGRAEAFVVDASVDPAGGKAVFVRWVCDRGISFLRCVVFPIFQCRGT